jgi:hypothetical protein
MALARTLFLAWIVCATTALGQEDGAKSESSADARAERSQYVVTGTLELRQNRFVLLNGDGVLEAYLLPRKSLQLDRYVGEYVELTVREPILADNGEPKLWVDRVAVPGQESAQGAVRQAAYNEKVTDGVEPARFSLPMLDEELIPGAGTATATVAAPQTAGPAGWIWGSAEYLMWKTQGMYVPALVTSSPVGTPQAQAGVLGQPNTQILFGEEDILGEEINGLRLRLGTWLDMENRYGVVGEAFGFQTNELSYQVSNDTSGVAIIARPFFNMNPRNPITNALSPPAREDSQLVCYPRLVDGIVSVNASSELQSGSLGLITLLASEGFKSNKGVASYSRVDLLAGYRFLRLNDQLSIADSFGSLDPDAPVEFRITDSFQTSNEFQGADLGMQWQGGWKRWTLEALVRTGLGNVRQEVTIAGNTVITTNGINPVVYANGLLAQPTNAGTYSRDQFSVIPELGATLGFQILPHLRATLGITYLYWGPVVRPGDQIDMDVNGDLLAPPITPMVGAARPAFDFEESTYWAGGVNFGIEGRW